MKRKRRVANIKMDKMLPAADEILFSESMKNWIGD